MFYLTVNICVDLQNLIDLNQPFQRLVLKIVYHGGDCSFYMFNVKHMRVSYGA